MNSRRSFFKTIASVVAAVAIAPEIAFRSKLELPAVTGWDVVTGWDIVGDEITCLAYSIAYDIDGGKFKKQIGAWKLQLDKDGSIAGLNLCADGQSYQCYFRPPQSPVQPSACSPSSTTRS